MYRIESLDRQGDDKNILGLWYEYQLQKVDQDEHRIDQVLRRQGDQVLVSWRGFEKNRNSCTGSKISNFISSILCLQTYQHTGMIFVHEY